MSDWTYIAVLVCTADLRDLTNQLAEALGHGPDTLSVPLSANGNEPATHYGCRTSVQQSFIDMINSAMSGDLPEVEGMAADQISSVLAGLNVDFSQTVDAYEHFHSVVTGMGLSIVNIT